MADRYSGHLGPSRAIYPSSQHTPFILLLVASKFFRSFGIFVSYDLLKLIHVVQFLFFVKAGASLFYIFLQKPFSSGKRITKHQWFRIGRHAFFGSIICILWLFGLTLCGPLRALLLFEHSDLVVLAGASAMFTSNGTPSRFRGAVFFLVAVMGILLFDHDDHQHAGESPHEHHGSFLTHMLEHMTEFTGLSDHKGGVVLLFMTLCLQTGYNSASKKLSVDVGGAKRLHALSTLVSTVLLAPWALFVSFTQESLVSSWLSLLIPLALVIVFVFVADYYVESVATNRIEAFRTARFGSLSVFVFAVVLSFVWNHPFVSSVTSSALGSDIHALVMAPEHLLSGGVIFSFVLFMFATHILSAPLKAGRGGQLVGYSPGGLPLYNFTHDALKNTSQSILLVAKNGLRQILSESDSRKIFYFLCINLSFTFVELVYGVWTNSLGLISDGFHMLFDCSALVMGLYASVMARWKATRSYSYGFDRVEILSGFTNGLFLMVIAFFVFTTALARVYDPPEIHTERLLVVSVMGLLVNLVGITAFSHGHTHGGGGGSHGHSHGGGGGGSHGHSHGSHGHSHGGGSHGHMTDNANMEGVFLHVLADTLGSVGVIVSTLLIEQFGWRIADPVCSLFIAVLIFASVAPLVKETALVLLLRMPDDIMEELSRALQKVMSVDGVVSYRGEHFWRHSSKVVCGTIHVQLSQDASEQKVVSQVTSLLKEAGVSNLTVQIEKPSYFQHMSGLGLNLDEVMDMAAGAKRTDYFVNNVNYINAI